MFSNNLNTDLTNSSLAPKSRMQAQRKEDTLNKVYNEDARNILKVVSSDTKISTTITSPPYFDMKDYGSENQVGYGQKYEEYLEDLKTIFSGVFELTKEDGSLWIVIDTFKRNGQVVTLPFDLSNKLKEIGWLLQDVIIWKKDKTVPWSNNGFMQRKFEYVLFFTKSDKFISNKDRVRVHDKSKLKKWWVKYPERYNPKGKALDEVWEFPIPVQGSWGKKYVRHFCPLPESLVATMINISTNENDIILDPFAGSGAVLSQSAYMKRNYIGFELNKSYIDLFNEYLDETLETKRNEYESLNNNAQNDFEKTILNLRALKYARVLFKIIQKQLDLSELKIFVEVKGKSEQRNKLIKVQYQLSGDFNESDVTEIINQNKDKKPLSTFGIEPIFEFLESFIIDPKKHYCYTENNTYSHIKQRSFDASGIDIVSEICVDLSENNRF